MLNDHFKITPDLYASKEKRFANFIIDRVVFYAVFFGLSSFLAIVYILLGGDQYALDEFANGLENISPLMDSLVTLIFLIIFYFAFETISKGKTIGKFVTKTKVIMEDGSEPKISDYLLRSLCRLIPFDSISFLGSEGRGWHDSVSDTYVIDLKKYEAKKTAQFNLEELGKPIQE